MQFGWTKALSAMEQTIDDLKYNNYVKEVYMDSDMQGGAVVELPVRRAGGLVHSAGAGVPDAGGAEQGGGVSPDAGAFHLHAGASGMPGSGREAIERFRPDSWKGYTAGDNTHKDTAAHPWKADDEKTMYPLYEKIAKSGIHNVCIHKGLFAPAVEARFPVCAPTRTSAISGGRRRTGRG